MKVGYMRVSTDEQNLDRQEEIMRSDEVERVFKEKASGKSADRPQLQEMMKYVREGDIVVVESISRLARNTRDLLSIIDNFRDKGVGFISHKENIDTDTPAGQFMLTLFGAMAELERGYILSRQAEGIAIAKKQGKYKGRVPIKIDTAKFERLYVNWKAGDITAVQAQKQLGLTASTFYRRVREFERKKEKGTSEEVLL